MRRRSSRLRRIRAERPAGRGEPAVAPQAVLRRPRHQPPSSPSGFFDIDNAGTVAEEGGDLRRAPEPVQASSTRRTDAADRDAQRRADVGIVAWWVTDQHRQQLAAVLRKLSERSAERSIAF